MSRAKMQGNSSFMIFIVAGFLEFKSFFRYENLKELESGDVSISSKNRPTPNLKFVDLAN